MGSAEKLKYVTHAAFAHYGIDLLNADIMLGLNQSINFIAFIFMQNDLRRSCEGSERLPMTSCQTRLLTSPGIRIIQF